jgi:hypothetical protein
LDIVSRTYIPAIPRSHQPRRRCAHDTNCCFDSTPPPTSPITITSHGLLRQALQGLPDVPDTAYQGRMTLTYLPTASLPIYSPYRSTRFPRPVSFSHDMDEEDTQMLTLMFFCFLNSHIVRRNQAHMQPVHQSPPPMSRLQGRVRSDPPQREPSSQTSGPEAQRAEEEGSRRRE